MNNYYIRVRNRSILILSKIELNWINGGVDMSIMCIILQVHLAQMDISTTKCPAEVVVAAEDVVQGVVFLVGLL